MTQSIFRNKNIKNVIYSHHFRGSDIEKIHAVMARNISKSKYIKYYIFVLFLAVQMSKKYMSLWCEGYFEITIYKILHNRATFKGSNAEKIYAIIVQKIFRNQNVKNTNGSKILLEVYISLRFTTFHYTPFQLHNYTPLH